MAGSNKQKYVAEGFSEDSSMLLQEFVELNTAEFPEFAALWRKHYFSLIFMGRPDHTETSEFVNEIFRITSQYLFSSSFYQQVGAVFILYALFRNQISEPSIKIRIELSHFKIIKSLREEAISKEYRTLHYVIEYLMDHAFLYVANQTLKGPLIGNMPKTSQEDERICNLKTTYKSDLMKYSATNNLQAIRNLQMEYIAEKKNTGCSSKVSLIKSHEAYEDGINELNDILDPCDMQEDDDLGGRRAKLKMKSFKRKSKNRFGVVSDDEEEEETEADDPDFRSSRQVRVHHKKKKRVPAGDRRVGRPRKKPKAEEKPTPESDDDIDISQLLAQHMNKMYLPPKNCERKLRTKRDAYYRMSPKPHDSDSETDSSDE